MLWKLEIGEKRRDIVGLKLFVFCVKFDNVVNIHGYLHNEVWK